MINFGKLINFKFKNKCNKSLMKLKLKSNKGKKRNFYGLSKKRVSE